MKGIPKHRSGEFATPRLAALLSTLLLFGLFGWAGFAHADETLEAEYDSADSQEEGEGLQSEIEAETCLDCHGPGIEGAPIVTHEMLGQSVHDQ